MNPGKLDILGTVQYDVGTTKNASGEPIRSWTTYCTLWLAKVAKTGNEGVVSGQLVATATEEFKYRSSDGSGITAKMRLVIGSEIYNITEPPVYVDRMYSKLICSRKDND